MKIGIIYAKKSGIMRRVIEPDDERELPAHRAEGEEILVVERGTGPLMQRAYEALYAHFGNPPPDPTCRVIDSSGHVVGHVAADPDLDRVPGHRLERVKK